MQLLKVLLVVLVAVNLSSGFFLKKKKTVYVHHPVPVYPPPAPVYHPPAQVYQAPAQVYQAPAQVYQAPAPTPVYQQYAAPYTYYYQSVPHYYYQPVYAAPAARVLPRPAPVPAPRAPPCPPPTVKQALPVFEPVGFNANKNVEIVKSVGFPMGTQTDVIEVIKSKDEYIEVPETVRSLSDGDDSTLIIDTVSPTVASSASAADTEEVVLDVLTPVVSGASTSVSSAAQTSVKTDLVLDLVSPLGDSGVSSDGNNLLLDIVPTDGASVATLSDSDSPGLVLDSVPSVLDSALAGGADVFRAERNPQFGAPAPVAGARLSAGEAFDFPEVQKVLRELINHEKFDAKRI